ncbi:hypothetical protein GJU40_07320 [Bacillus lacus]|uniref:Holin n=1 Tax=Metabacillus lacus TaxID=1983721 RepID=A0A7X2IYF5_9BACI|nr:hypothetical protein [Metabacillus lacus]MRX71980.1 hypothetical protein [Metabacillus lacus]
MEEFPVIHTNIWDVVLAIPLVVIATQIMKYIFRIQSQFVPTMAVIFGLSLSILFAHQHHIWAALFMGFFYGNAAIGTYSSMKTSISWYRDKYN